MGDVILATSVFSYLKSSFPESKIWFVTGKEYGELFVRDPRLERVIGIEKGRENEQVRELEGMTWERVIDLQNNRHSMMIRSKIGSRQSVGVFRKLHFERFLLLALRHNMYEVKNHVIARYAQAAGSSATSFPPATLFIDRQNCESICEFNPPASMVRPMLALFPFSNWKNKEWPLRYYEYVGRYFTVKGWHVIIFFTKAHA
jgi:ADP-heptose:LPS heptosyltransferase